MALISGDTYAVYLCVEMGPASITYNNNWSHKRNFRAAGMNVEV